MAEQYKFGEFILDASERRLSRDSRVIPLEPKAHDVLVALVRKAGRLVTKRELLDLVWPEAFVEDGILAVHISSLRKALGEREGGRRHIETVSRAGYRFIGGLTRPEADREPSAKRWSVAVLPAQAMASEMFSERDRPVGLTLADALIERLGRFQQILVRPTRAVRGYANPQDNLAAAGQLLRVDAVLDSTFLRTADRVRVSARLVRSSDGARVWSGEFDEPATDILAIADAVAGSVAAYLGFDAQKGQRRVRRMLRPELYELLGRGRSHLLSASVFEVPQAIAAFRAAIELEPTHAAAHAGLALACCAQAQYRLAPPAQAYSDAKDAALRALAMDDRCADAQVALGAALFFSEWNWAGAERSLERALDLNPNHTEAHLLYGSVMEALGNLETGLDMKLRALERDPFSPLVHLQISMSYWNQRRYDDSIEWANKALELDPRHPHAREHLAGAYLKKRDFDSYMAENIKHAESHGCPPEALDPLKQAYAAGGHVGIVRLVLERASRQPDAFPSVQLAVNYGEAGDLDAAFLHLDRAMECHDPALVYLAVGPQWDSLRGDPRMGQRLTRMGLGQLLDS